jgi:CRISPR/Cas system-associated exonuclease Cas4 (RecB family)
MQISENPRAAEAMIRQAHATHEARSPRAEGLHVSDLIYCLRKAWYRRAGVPAPDLHPDELQVLLLGHSQHVLLQCEGERERPITLALGGETVHGTVDLLLHGKLPVEIKTTRTSSKKAPQLTAPHYLEQLAAYCLGLRNRSGRLAVWHLHGDYGQHRLPQLKVWDVTFTARELERWEAELSRRVTLVTTDTPPAPGDHYDWECRYCPFHEARGGPCPGGPGREAPFFVDDNLPTWAQGEEP